MQKKTKKQQQQNKTLYLETTDMICERVMLNDTCKIS